MKTKHIIIYIATTVLIALAIFAFCESQYFIGLSHLAWAAICISLLRLLRAEDEVIASKQELIDNYDPLMQLTEHSEDILKKQYGHAIGLIRDITGISPNVLIGKAITDPRSCDGCPNETEDCRKLYTKQGEICVHHKI
jgi:hypothetical protein